MDHVRDDALLLAILLASVLAPAMARDARAAPSDGVARPYDVVVELQPGKRVRLETAAGRTLEGEFARNTRDSLYLARGDTIVVVPLAGTRRLWVCGGSSGKGGLVGAAVGGLTLATLSADEVSDTGGLGFVLGAIAGGFVGALVGKAVPAWDLRYEAPAPADSVWSLPAAGLRPAPRAEPRVAGGILGGYSPDDEGPCFSVRALYTSTPRFALGLEYVHFEHEESGPDWSGFSDVPLESRTETAGISFLTRMRFGEASVRPIAIGGVSFLEDRESRTIVLFDYNGSPIGQTPYESSGRIVGFFLGPGLDIGGKGFHLTLEGRWMLLAGRGQWEDIVGLMGGIGYR